MTDADSTPLTDRRRIERMRTLIETALVYGEPGVISACRILDLSPVGAMIEVEPSLVLLRPLRLLLALDGVACEARVAWRSGELAGLAFTRRYDLRGEVSGAVVLLQQIWNDRQG